MGWKSLFREEDGGFATTSIFLSIVVAHVLPILLWKFVLAPQKKTTKPLPPKDSSQINVLKKLPTILDDPNASSFLSLEQIQLIWEHDFLLPITITWGRPWKCSYRLSQHGDSFSSFLHHAAAHEETLLVVQTTQRILLGAYVSSPWMGQPGYFGTGQARLFTFYHDGHADNKCPQIEVYKWTGQNDYIQLCDIHNKRIALGGGSGSTGFGLCLEDSFSVGSSAPCATFGNETSLVGGDKQKEFAILDVELWTFPKGVFR